jgi:uridine kinase
MHRGFVEPSKRHADIVIPHGGSNDVAIEMVAGAVRARLTES